MDSRQGYISGLPEELIFLILHNLEIKDVYNFLQTSVSLAATALKTFLSKIVDKIQDKLNTRNQDLYHKTLDEVRDVYKLLFHPGNLYKNN